MKKFKFKNTKLKDAKIIIRVNNQDKRGYLSRLYCIDELSKLNKSDKLKQINLSYTSKKKTFRGFHYQLNPYSEVKYVTCLQGKIFDIIIDLRKKSPTFLKAHCEILSEKDKKTLFVPKGFAHGFLSLVDNCKILYLHTERYNSKFERGINLNDPLLKISLPHSPLHISKRDQNFEFLNNNFKGIKV